MYTLLCTCARATCILVCSFIFVCFWTLFVFPFVWFCINTIIYYALLCVCPRHFLSHNCRRQRPDIHLLLRYKSEMCVSQLLQHSEAIWIFILPFVKVSFLSFRSSEVTMRRIQNIIKTMAMVKKIKPRRPAEESCNVTLWTWEETSNTS